MPKTSLAIRNVVRKFGFAEQARSAETPEDHQQVLDRVEAELADSKQRLAHLESRRESILLEGGDINTFHGELANAREVVQTLQATYREASRRHEEAKATRYSRDLEVTVADIRDNDAPALEQALRDWHMLGQQFADVGERVLDLSKRIRNVDDNSKAHDRPDLVIDHRAIRARVVSELMAEDDESDKPVRFGRGGEPDIEEGRRLYLTNTEEAQKAYAVWTSKHGTIRWAEHESNEAFAHRMMTWSSRQQDKANRDDPFRLVGKRVIEQAEVMLRPEDVHTASRQERRVEVSRYVTADGRPVANASFADSLPGKGNFGPRPLVKMG